MVHLCMHMHVSQMLYNIMYDILLVYNYVYKMLLQYWNMLNMETYLPHGVVLPIDKCHWRSPGCIHQRLP